jgi:hypothetical protein
LIPLPVANLLELLNVLPPAVLPRLFVTTPLAPRENVVLPMLRLKIEEAAFLVAVELNAVVCEEFVHVCLTGSTLPNAWVL